MEANIQLNKHPQRLLKIILYFLSAIITAGCGMQSNREIVDISGAYSLVTKENKGSLADTNSEGITKLKIYAEDYYMHAEKKEKDSATSFEIGTYKLVEGKLKQNVIFSSFGTTSLEKTNFIYDINKNEDGDIQITKNATPEQNDNLSYVENYEYIGLGNKHKSMVDGAWKQISTYAVTDKDTIWDKGANFKILHDGYIIWGDFHINPAIQKHDTYMGFGTFVMKGNSRLEETFIKSNYSTNEGKTFYIDIEFIEDDIFKQSILDSITGISYIEVYQRLQRNNR